MKFLADRSAIEERAPEVEVGRAAEPPEVLMDQRLVEVELSANLGDAARVGGCTARQCDGGISGNERSEEKHGDRNDEQRRDQHEHPASSNTHASPPPFELSPPGKFPGGGVFIVHGTTLPRGGFARRDRATRHQCHLWNVGPFGIGPTATSLPSSWPCWAAAD